MIGPVGLKALLPVLFARAALCGGIPGRAHILRYFKRSVHPTHCLTGERNLFVAERRTVTGFFTLLVGRTPADHGATADKRGPLAVGVSLVNGPGNRSRIVAVDALDNLPVVGAKTRRGVISEPALYFAVDGDAVVIPEGNELTQAQCTGKRAGFVGDSFHQATVAQENVSMVIDYRMTIAVELRSEYLLGQRHTHTIRDALTQGPSSGLYARGVTILGVAGRARVQLAKILELFYGQIVAGEVQQRVMQHRAVAIGKDETIAIGPLGVSRVVA